MMPSYGYGSHSQQPAAPTQAIANGAGYAPYQQQTYVPVQHAPGGPAAGVLGAMEHFPDDQKARMMHFPYTT